MRDVGSVGVGQYLLVERVEVDVGVPACLSASETQAAEDALERTPHVLVTVRVDDGVHHGIKLRQDQEELLHFQHAAVTLHTIQQQQHQTWSPAEHEAP